MAKHISRRDFILLVTGTAGVLLISCKAGDEQEIGVAVPTLVPESFNPTASPQAGSAEGFDFSAPDPYYGEATLDQEIVITPVERFYTQSFAGIPRVDASSWRLTIDGLVEKPLSLSYDELLALEAVTEMRTLECIGNPLGGDLIGNATWTGFYLKPLLEQAGIKQEAIRARFYAADQYTTSADLKWIMQDDTLMVYAMNGEPLTPEHGFPLRIMMPGLYGQKMPKWIERIELIDYAHLGYWESMGWSDVAAVKTNSQISRPENFARMTGTFVIEGWAYAGKRAITAVEVSIDNGEWMPCELLHGPSPQVWTQWWYTWQPERTGTFRFSVRATDEDGFTQNERGQFLEGAFPDGTDKIHTLAYTIDPPGSGG